MFNGEAGYVTVAYRLAGNALSVRDDQRCSQFIAQADGTDSTEDFE